MPPLSRLSGADIRAFRAQRRLHGTLLSIGIAPMSGARRAKIAFIVSKKVAAKATVRNALKRVLRDAARAPLERLAPLALVVTVKSAAAAAPKAALRAELTKLLGDLGAVA